MLIKRVPLELQDKRGECGLACLAMVLGYYDQQTDLSSLRRQYVGFDQGVTLKDLAGFAQQSGYLTRGVRTEPQQLHQLQLPAILHWDLDHFVVLVHVGRKGCVLHDPAKGRVRCSWHDLQASFTGVVLELWPPNAKAR